MEEAGGKLAWEGSVEAGDRGVGHRMGREELGFATRRVLEEVEAR